MIKEVRKPTGNQKNIPLGKIRASVPREVQNSKKPCGLRERQAQSMKLKILVSGFVHILFL